jgi:hypothetical protein
VNFKAWDDSALSRFWAEALGWVVSSEVPGVTNVEPVGFVWPDPAAVCIDVVTVPDPDHARLRASAGVGPYLEFVRAPAGKSVWGRVHLDLKPYPGDDQAAEMAGLRALGATDADVGQGDVPWVCLADSEGEDFCVLTPG